MKKFLALTLCLVMILAVLTGCGKSKKEEPLVGQWKATVDMTNMMNKSMATEDADMAKYFTFANLTFNMTMVFEEDGKCSLTVDQATWKAMAEKIGSTLKDGMTKYLNDQLAESGITLDQYLASAGVTLDSMIDPILSSMVSDEMLKQMENSGYYQLSDGKLFIDESKDAEFDEKEANPYVLSGDKLVIQVSESEKGEPESEVLFPLELTKVK